MNATDLPQHAFWCRIPSRPNFGDALTPWLIRRLAGRYPRFVMPDDPRAKFFVCGSIVALAGPGCTVWGAGLINSDDAVSPAARFLAVRGPRTRARALACGADCPAVYGDPALLLPRLHAPQSVSRQEPGLVAHFSDRPRLDAAWVAAQGLRLIDIQQDTETVIDQVASCEWVMSSSLHGLIVAHAYGVPALWVRLRDLPSGDGTKFADHYEALGAPVPVPVTLQTHERLDRRRLERMAWCPSQVNTDTLWRSCPFRRDDC
jgi:pyruvyltransferase